MIEQKYTSDCVITQTLPLPPKLTAQRAVYLDYLELPDPVPATTREQRVCFQEVRSAARYS